MSDPKWYYYLTPYIQYRDKIKKLACLFAGLGHMQPLLLATTNSHYLLDRFCMERCCSSEYVSRIVTSLIFMEILSIIVVRIVLIIVPTGLRTIIGRKDWLSWLKLPDATDLNYGKKEEEIRGIAGSIILFLISLGYLQILYAFTTGGRKGHMHWFYISLMFQQFVCLLIGGAIGFWEGGVTLWYLMAIPMGPILVFFYQLYIHSWIRNNGPRSPEYIVMENQTWLATAISCIATLLWTAGYSVSYDKAELNLATAAPANIIGESITLIVAGKTGTGPITLTSTPGQPTQAAPITVTATVKPGQASKYNVTITATINSMYSGTITLYNRTLNNVSGAKSLTSNRTNSITVQSNGSGKPTQTVKSDNTGTVTVQFDPSVTPTGLTNETYTYTYKTLAPNLGYYISQVKGPKASGTTELWKAEWDGGECEYAEYYERETRTTLGGGSSTTEALAAVHVRILGGLDIRYFGTDNTASASGQWRIIETRADFNTYLEKLRGTEDLDINTEQEPSDTKNFVRGIANENYNTNFGMVFPSYTLLPLIMQGLSVGAVGSIFPNLIPKTLTSPKTTRTLSVINMFLVTVPHIFNVMLGDMDLLSRIGVGAPWEGGFHTVWLLYLIYGLAILFAIFNIHYPEWALSTFLRNNTWMVFLMILFTDVLNETFNAISRAGICSQKTAGREGKKNHPCLYNKIVPLNVLGTK